MESISLPNKISINPDKENPHKGELTIEPLYPGYGPTIANAMRRVLLSSLPGAAIFAFKIKGVQHEFSTIDYVKEDVVDISLNLKRINLTSHSDEIVKLELKGEGEKVLTAGDIAANSDIEIANPDQPIMTLTDKAASIEMTLWVRQGRGYEPIEMREDELEVNAIAVDSIFSPIINVGFTHENVRVGGRTDYDKVVMEIETNGTITVEEAVVQSSKLLADHFQVISQMQDSAVNSDEENSKKDDDDKEESKDSEDKE